MVKLGSVADVRISGVDKKTIDGESPVRLCNYTDVYYNWTIRPDMSNPFMVASARREEIEKFRLHAGQVAITKDSETRDDIGHAAYVAIDFDDVILGYHCALITPHIGKLDGQYLNALFRTRYMSDYLARNAGGSGQRYYLSESAIREIPITLPSYESQLRIAGVLGSLDKKIELNRRKIAELEALAKTIYDYWFVQFDFPDKNGKPYRSSGGKMIWNKQLKREVPDGWDIRPLSSFSERITKGTTPTSIGCSFTNTGVRFIKVENIVNGAIEIDNGTNYISEQTDSKMSRSRLFENDLLITIAGRLGDVAIVSQRILPANTNQAVGIVRLNKDHLPIVHYLSMYLSTAQMKTRLQTLNAQSIQKNLNLENVGQIDILFNPSAMAKFEYYVCPIQEKLEYLREEIEALITEREALLPLLMNGQAKVR